MSEPKKDKVFQPPASPFKLIWYLSLICLRETRGVQLLLNKIIDLNIRANNQ